MSSYAKYSNVGTNFNSRLGQQTTDVNIIHIKDMEQKNKLINENKIVCIDVYADWCGPCKMIENSYNILSQKFPSIAFAKENYELGLTTITGIPTFYIYVNGVLQKNIVGADINAVENLLSTLYTSNSNIQYNPDNQHNNNPNQQKDLYEQFAFKNTKTDLSHKYTNRRITPQSVQPTDEVYNKPYNNINI